VERARVGPADIHARAAADGLKALKDLDRRSIIAVGRRRSVGREQVGHLQRGIGRGFLPCQARGDNELWISGLARLSLADPDRGGGPMSTDPMELYPVIAQIAGAFAGFGSLASGLERRRGGHDARIDAYRLWLMLFASLSDTSWGCCLRP